MRHSSADRTTTPVPAPFAGNRSAVCGDPIMVCRDCAVGFAWSSSDSEDRCAHCADRVARFGRARGGRR